MSLVFLEKAFLWVLLLVPLLWWVPRPVRDGWHGGIRSVIVVLLILALARPALVQPEQDAWHILLWDRSESIDDWVSPEVESAVSNLLERLSGDANRRVVAINGDRGPAPALHRVRPLNLEGSSISDALDAAVRLLPDGARGAVTLVSDGRATDRQWGEAVRQLSARKIPVHSLAVAAPADKIYPAALHVREPLRMGHMARIEVDVVGTAEAVVVTLWAGDELLARSAPTPLPGRARVGLEFEPVRAGFIDVRARVELAGETPGPGGPDMSHNDLAYCLAVQAPLRAMYLSERLIHSGEKLGQLLGRGIELVEPSAAQLQQVARDPAGLAAFDLVLIDDRPSESIPMDVQEAMVRAVQEDGVGLFYAGGKGVFGTGGYFDTPLASILPVEMLQKEEKRDPSTTLVVIIDTSGSMGGERVQLAKECARLALRRLLPHDKAGIVEFYGTKQWAAPIQSAANAIEIQRAINRLDAGGGTVILPAIEEAFYALLNVQTRYKHVLVLTDGGVEAGDFEALIRRMADHGINVSTVLVGGDAHSEFLVDIANWGKGHFYAASSRFHIPEILLKQPSTSKIPPYRPGFHPVDLAGTSAWWGEVNRPQDPALRGYVETRLRPGAQVIMETEKERHPVLASWRHGLGRVTALMSEPVGPGTEPWTDWRDYGAWLSRVLTRTSREHSQPFDFRIERGRHEARLTARRLTPHRHRPEAERITSSGAGEAVIFDERAPDLFLARITAARTETLRFRAGAEGWEGPPARVVSPAVDAAAPEHNVDPDNSLDLARLAGETGGRQVTLAQASGWTPRAGGGGSALTLTGLWPWCLGLALAGYLGDLFYRRWPGRRVE